jgi:hypothetical protein
LTTANSHINYLISAVLLIYCANSYGQNEEEWSLFSGNYPAVIINTNVGSAIPFPFYNIPEERHVNMVFQPYLGLQLNHMISPKSYLKFNISYSAKAADFSAVLVDQPYNGSMEQEVNGKISEVYVEDAYFSGNSQGSYRLKYVELNSSFGRRIGKNGGLYLGIYLAFLLDAENEVFVDGTVSLGPKLPPVSTQFQRVQDYKKYINKTDFGFQLGYEHRLYKKLNANGQFSTGLYSIYSRDLEAVEFSMINMYISLGFTYFIGTSMFD